MGDRTATYRARAERNGHGWSVTIEGLSGHAPSERFRARDLAEVEPKALKLIWACTGIDHDRVDLDIDVRLPPATQLHLELIRQMCADIEAEYDAVTAEMVNDMGMPLLDVARVLGLYRHQPRPLTITNREIAEHGLNRHPDAVGVEWQDHGFALTRLCRHHVDAIRRTYRDLDPDGLSALTYDDRAWCCDRCYEGDDRQATDGLR